MTGYSIFEDPAASSKFRLPPKPHTAKPIDLALLTPDVRARFAEKVSDPDPVTSCRVWLASGDGRGYGRFWLAGRLVRAHRLAFVLHHGADVPPGLVLDHLCRNRGCVSPNHLAPVTVRENNLAPGALTDNARRHAQTHCGRGHLLFGLNLVESALARGSYLCRACANAANARGHARRRGVEWTESDVQAYADARYAEFAAEMAALDAACDAEINEIQEKGPDQ